jgi:hypothetical protein
MDAKGYRPPIPILLAAAASLALAVLFFAPWLELSAEPQEEMKQGIYHFAPNLPSEIRKDLGKQVESWSFARADGPNLLKGRLEAYHDAAGAPVIQEGFLTRRRWVVFCAVLPAVFILTCLGTLARLMAKPRTGGYLALGGIAGIVLMILVGTTDFYEDLRVRVEQEGNTRSVRDESQLAAWTGTFQSMQVLGGKETFRTHTTRYFWISLGLYGFVAICGLAARAPDGAVDSEPPPATEEGPMLRHRLAFAARQPAPPDSGHRKPPPDFGPDLEDEPREDDARRRAS